ncbi:MAG: hypothetical protein QW815_07900, partial [Nitrososphaerota archaeon]
FTADTAGSNSGDSRMKASEVGSFPEGFPTSLTTVNVNMRVATTYVIEASALIGIGASSEGDDSRQ